MFLLLNAIVASLDGLIIGISLRLGGTKITKKNIITILIGNYMIYAFFLLLYYYFQFTFMTKNITTLLYLILAWNAYRNKNTLEFKTNTLSFRECLLITLTHSLDGTIVSLSFVYNYSVIHIVAIFSAISLLLLLCGYYFSKIVKTKKENLISSILFLILAIINHFL